KRCAPGRSTPGRPARPDRAGTPNFFPKPVIQGGCQSVAGYVVPARSPGGWRGGRRPAAKGPPLVERWRRTITCAAGVPMKTLRYAAAPVGLVLGLALLPAARADDRPAPADKDRQRFERFEKQAEQLRTLLK